MKAIKKITENEFVVRLNQKNIEIFDGDLVTTLNSDQIFQLLNDFDETKKYLTLFDNIGNIIAFEQYEAKILIDMIRIAYLENQNDNT